MKNAERQFKGVWIPAEIFEDTGLSPLCKILWADIDSFTGNGGVFYKSNEAIASQYVVSERTVTRALKQLETAGHIEMKIIGGRRREITSSWQGRVDNLATQSRQNGDAASPKWRGRVDKMSTKNNNRDTTLETNNLERVELPWYTVNFGWAWEEWLREKKDRKEKYTVRAQRMALKRLVSLSGDNEAKAIEIIHQSLANSWKGFFPLKQDKKNGFTSENFTPDGIKSFIAQG